MLTHLMTRFSLLYTLLFCTVLYSQTAYKTGYFINNNNEKTDCFIKDEDWVNNPSGFTYKLTKESEALQLKINDASEFGFDGNQIYKRFEVSIDLSSNNVSSLSNRKEPEWTKRIVYLKTVTQGNLTLYRYEQGDITKYFYSSTDYITAEQLVYKKYSIGGKIAENNNFRQQLYNLMKEKYPNKEKFKSVEYQQRELEKLFMEYNGVEESKQDQKSNKGKINLKVTVGAAIAKLYMQQLVSGEHYNFSDKTIFAGGAELEYILPFNNNKWSLFINPNIQFYKNNYKQDVYEADINYKYLQIPVGVRHYMYLNNKSGIFINAAYVFSGNLNSEMIYSRREIPVTIANGSSAMFGAGYSYSKYSAEIRYNTKHGIVNTSSWSSEYSSIGIMLSYNFL